MVYIGYLLGSRLGAHTRGTIGSTLDCKSYDSASTLAQTSGRIEKVDPPQVTVSRIGGSTFWILPEDVARGVSTPWKMLSKCSSANSTVDASVITKIVAGKN